MNDYNKKFRPIPQHWDESVDVVIVGSGYAGLAAATEAAGQGAGVVILEKMSRYGGNSLISGGGFAASDSLHHFRQKFGLGEDSWQQHMEDTLRGGDNYNLPELVEVMARFAPDGLNWLIDAGAKFRETLPRIGGHSANRIHIADKLGVGLTRPLKKMALDHGAELRLKARVTTIWRKDPQSPVLGVEVVKEGVARNIKVKRALVLAAGGFGSDIKLRMGLNPSLVPAYGCTNHRHATGEAITCARAVWADVLHMEFIQLYPCANPKNGTIDPHALHPYSGTSFGLLYVNTAGERFVNELDRRDVVSNAQIKSGGKPSYAVLNGEIFKKLAVPSAELSSGLAGGRIIEALSISDLAHQLKMNPGALEATVHRHNEYITDGTDPDFGKPIVPAMVPITTGPFYAIAQWPAIHHTMGGLRIDTKARVIDIWGNPIPGLYAAGEVCGGIHGANRLGGNAIADCIVFGRIAGTHAATDIVYQS